MKITKVPVDFVVVVVVVHCLLKKGKATCYKRIVLSIFHFLKFLPNADTS